MKTLFVILIGLMLFFTSDYTAHACDPASTLSLGENVSRAELIIIGEPTVPAGYRQETVEMKVYEVLKGNAPSTIITAEAWSG